MQKIDLIHGKESHIEQQFNLAEKEIFGNYTTGKLTNPPILPIFDQ